MACNTYTIVNLLYGAATLNAIYSEVKSLATVSPMWFSKEPAWHEWRCFQPYPMASRGYVLVDILEGVVLLSKCDAKLRHLFNMEICFYKKVMYLTFINNKNNVFNKIIRKMQYKDNKSMFLRAKNKVFL